MDIEPGTVNDERTRYCCRNCEKEYPFDPNWKSIKDVPDCPDCYEEPFSFKCCDPGCQYQAYDVADDAAFADQGCCECGQTQEDSERMIHEEEEQMEREIEEDDRIKRAKAHRERKEGGIHQNRIQHTMSSMRESDQTRMSILIQNPKSPADALRMSEDDFARIKPLIEHELQNRGLDPSKYLTPRYCKQLISFFERSWLADNEEGLRHGITLDVAGIQSMVFFYRRENTKLQVRLRSIRESYDESIALFPTAPAVRVIPADKEHDEFGLRELAVEWDNDYDGEDAREIYQMDGTTTLTFAEFLVWEARVGGFFGEEPNRKYCDPYSDLGQPIAYVPSDWVGKPKEWEEERDSGFARWFWMRTRGASSSTARLTELSKMNMRKCCNCYGLPESENPNDLILCDCGEMLFCSDKCKEEVWRIHKYSKSHCGECNNCLKSSHFLGPSNLLRCSKCKKVMYCDQFCQRTDWPVHKKSCAKR